MTESLTQWTNWVGNRSCNPSERRAPTSVDDVRTAVQAARDAGRRVRVAASGHSYTDICTTDGTLIELCDYTGITHMDPDACRVTLRPGTRIEEIGDPLWEAGLSLHNQGDIEAQQIAGAVSTGTHGSGLSLRNMAAAIQSLDLVTADGSIRSIDDSNPELLAAARVSVGMLGVITSLTLDVAPAFKIREVVRHWPHDELVQRWHDAFATHRHFSFFWCPTSTAHKLYDLECPADLDMCDVARVKSCDPVPMDTPDDMAVIGARTGRPYRIYPQCCEPNLHELEYMLPFEHGTEAFERVRRVVLDDPEHGVFPVEVRATAGDDAMLSPNHQADSLVISVSGQPGKNYEPFLRRIHDALREFNARPHWGKLHFFTREELARVLPRHGDFVQIRRELDVDGLFLNDSLRPLFA
jgi:FAD/FMN-containing dehydrogenase